PPTRAHSGRHAGDLALSRAHVEDVVGAGHMSRGQGQDLLDVFGVGALGEALLPPPGVGLPRVRRPRWVGGPTRGGAWGWGPRRERRHCHDRAGEGRWSFSCTAWATFSGSQGSSSSSSRVARFTAPTLPSCFSR